MNNFIDELFRRKMELHQLGITEPIPDEKYSLYVRLCRMKLKLNREQLANKVQLPRNTITFIEQGNLLPGELTQEIEQKLSRVFRMSLAQFEEANPGLLDKSLEKYRQLEEESIRELNKTLGEGYE